MNERSYSTPYSRSGMPSSITKAIAVQSGASCASITRGNDLMRLMEQPGRLRMVCSAEMVRTSGVKSTLRFRTELRNSSTSENLKTCGASTGRTGSFFIECQDLRISGLAKASEGLDASQGNDGNMLRAIAYGALYQKLTSQLTRAGCLATFGCAAHN